MINMVPSPVIPEVTQKALSLVFEHLFVKKSQQAGAIFSTCGHWLSAEQVEFSYNDFELLVSCRNTCFSSCIEFQFAPYNYNVYTGFWGFGEIGRAHV